MLPKDPSVTTSTKFDSNKTSKARPTGLDTPLQYLKGVGPKLSFLLENIGLKTVGDALFYFPRSYQDRSHFTPISDLQAETQALVQGSVIGSSFIPLRNSKKSMYEVRIRDASKAVLSLRWFHYNRSYLESKAKDLPTVVAYGLVKSWGGKLSMMHADIEWDVDASDAAGAEKLLSIYSETEGLHQKLIRKIIKQALELGLASVVDDLPVTIRKEHGLPDFKQAISFIHYPRKDTSLENLLHFNTPEQKRMIFDELFKFEWVVGKRRLSLRSEKADTFPFSTNDALYQGFCKRIPFELTSDQKHSIEKIFEDLNTSRPMSRLLQGDVGCGKTLVTLAATLPLAFHGAQSVLMAPTEILARQHLANAEKYLTGLSLANGKTYTIECLTGSTTKSQKQKIIERLKSGEIHLLIGTHALIEDDVEFNRLGLILIDEQHRFGVDQRLKLRKKGKATHCLLATATPIPRTLALTAYGDLDVSIIRELPKGRPEILTTVVRPENRDDLYNQIEAQLKEGRQAYLIYPLVEESEKIDLANAVEGAENLKNGRFKNYSLGLLHGKMSNIEKSQVMENFKNGKIQILVSTTVVEVGVDVPNATVLAIEHAERFGLSQLHQLRGRIGRGVHRSFCFLIAKNTSDIAFERLSAMEQTRDGFKLAELDLQIRGPGDFLGTKQSGDLQFQYANLVRDQEILLAARKAAFELISEDPDLINPENASLRKYMQVKGHIKQQRFETA